MEIKARQTWNGETVRRPKSYRRAAGDQWAVDFEIQTLNDKQARDVYSAMKNIKIKLLREEAWYERYYRTSFMAHINYLSESGRHWRSALDKLDNNRETVVFSPHES
jgi:hypothetical protein